MNEIIRVTDLCNQKCLFCNFSETAPPLAPDDLYEKIDNLVNDNTEQIIFSGGEPTIYPHIFKGIKYAKLKGIKYVEIQSNGMNFSLKSEVKKYKLSGLDSVFVSLHSHKEKVYDYLTQISSGFSRVIQGINNVLQIGIRTRINIVINNKNYINLLNLTKFIHINFPDIESIDYSFIVSQGRALKNSYLIPKISAVIPYLSMAYKYCEKNNIKYYNPGCGIPICFIPQYKNISLEYFELKSLDKNKNKMINKNIKNKVKIGKCQNCADSQNCLGVWQGYLDIHGIKEFMG